MKFLSVLSLLALMLTASIANAAIRPYYQDIKLPTQKMVEYQSFPDLAAAASTTVLSNGNGATSAAAATTTSFSANPDVPRNLTITASGPNYNRLLGGTIVVSGTDYLNNSISESFVIAAGNSSAVVGNKAFKTVTSVAFPATIEASPYDIKWYIGQGEKIGLKRCMDKAGHILHSTLNGAKEATAPTMAADASTVSLNTADFNGTMNGTNDFELFFMQNFRCLR